MPRLLTSFISIAMIFTGACGDGYRSASKQADLRLQENDSASRTVSPPLRISKNSNLEQGDIRIIGKFNPKSKTLALVGDQAQVDISLARVDLGENDSVAYTEISRVVPDQYNTFEFTVSRSYDVVISAKVNDQAPLRLVHIDLARRGDTARIEIDENSNTAAHIFEAIVQTSEGKNLWQTKSIDGAMLMDFAKAANVSLAKKISANDIKDPFEIAAVKKALVKLSSDFIIATNKQIQQSIKRSQDNLPDPAGSSEVAQDISNKKEDEETQNTNEVSSLDLVAIRNDAISTFEKSIVPAVPEEKLSIAKPNPETPKPNTEAPTPSAGASTPLVTPSVSIPLQVPKATPAPTAPTPTPTKESTTPSPAAVTTNDTPAVVSPEPVSESFPATPGESETSLQNTEVPAAPQDTIPQPSSLPQQPTSENPPPPAPSATVSSPTGCVITMAICRSDASKSGSFYETDQLAATNQSACLARAIYYFSQCDNRLEDTVTATFMAEEKPIASSSTASGCVIEQEFCYKNPEKTGLFFAEDSNAQASAADCLEQATHIHRMCANKFTEVTKVKFLQNGVITAEKDTATGCWVEQNSCQKHPEYTGGFFDFSQASQEDQKTCLLRAVQIHRWCGNGSSDVTSTMYFQNGQLVGQSNTLSNCIIKQDACKNFPELVGQFTDTNKEAQADEAKCLARAAEFHRWCGNSVGEITSAEYFAKGNLKSRASTSNGCFIEQKNCRNHPDSTGAFMDNKAEAHRDKESCLRRAAQYAAWCGNTISDSTTARFVVEGQTQAVRDTTQGCWIEQQACLNDEDLTGTFVDYRDNADISAKQCLKRAEEIHRWCGNQDEHATTASFYDKDGKKIDSATFFPQADKEAHQAKKAAESSKKDSKGKSSRENNDRKK